MWLDIQNLRYTRALPHAYSMEESGPTHFGLLQSTVVTNHPRSNTAAGIGPTKFPQAYPWYAKIELLAATQAAQNVFTATP